MAKCSGCAELRKELERWKKQADMERIGYNRYEKIRKMTPRDFNMLFAKTIDGYRFDDLVDSWQRDDPLQDKKV